LLPRQTIFAAPPARYYIDTTIVEATVTTKSRELLESMFRTVVATAHPSRCLPPHLPDAPPRGRSVHESPSFTGCVRLTRQSERF